MVTGNAPHHLRLVHLGSGRTVITCGPVPCAVPSTGGQGDPQLSVIARCLQRVLQILPDKPPLAVRKSPSPSPAGSSGPLPISSGPGILALWPGLCPLLLFCENMVIFSGPSSQDPPQPSPNFNVFQGCAGPMSSPVCCPRNWRSVLEGKSYLSQLGEQQREEERREGADTST